MGFFNHLHVILAVTLIPISSVAAIRCNAIGGTNGLNPFIPNQGFDIVKSEDFLIRFQNSGNDANMSDDEEKTYVLAERESVDDCVVIDFQSLPLYLHEGRQKFCGEKNPYADAHGVPSMGDNGPQDP